MTERNRIPSIADNDKGGMVAPSIENWGLHDKMILRLYDIYLTGVVGYEVNVNQSNELLIYSDRPVEVSINSPANWKKAQTRWSIKGVVQKIFIRVPLLGAVATVLNGRVTIYMGRPLLGNNFERESWLYRQPIYYGSGNIAVNAGIDNGTGALVTIPTDPADIFGVAGYLVTEAVYIISIGIVRSAGVISNWQLLDFETGAPGFTMFYELIETPADRVLIQFSQPLRIATSFKLWWHGSAEPGATTFNWQINAIIT